MIKKKIIALFMVLLALVVFSPVTDIAGSAALRRQITEIEQRRNAARAEVRESQNLLAGIESGIDNLLDIMRGYAHRMEVALEHLEIVELELLYNEMQMMYAQDELDKARIDRELQDKLFRARLRAMHEQGPVGYLEVLLHSANFMDMLIGFEHMRSIARHDQELLTNRIAAEERFEHAVSDLARLHRDLEVLAAQYDEQIITLQQIQEEQTATLTALYQDAENATAFLMMQEAHYIATGAELSEAQAQLQRVLDEENRQRLILEQQRREAEAAARAANMTSLSTNFSGTFIWPIASHHPISSYFGNRPNPFNRSRTQHHSGVDIAAPAGTRINAAAAGYVVLAGWSGGYGLTVIIQHDGPYRTLYAHNSRNRVSVGDRVTQGQHIADVGTTGQSTGNHLHFEIRRNNVAINPRTYFPWLTR